MNHSGHERAKPDDNGCPDLDSFQEGDDLVFVEAGTSNAWIAIDCEDAVEIEQ